ncbi:MAG: ATP-dependent Clp protease proteolytic subunit [Ilumatobacteraceae bacterium]
MSSYTIPTVVESTPRGERISDIYSRLLADRIVFIGTPIDDGVANVVVAQLLHLSAAGPGHDIHLYINSPGGSFTAMMAIYDTMQFVGCDVSTICVGQASSCAAVLLAAGAAGKRAVLGHARVMLDQPHTGGARGSMSDLALEASELARLRSDVDGILARHIGITADEVRAATDRALVLVGDAAVRFGVVDRVAVAPDSGSQHLDAGRALVPGDEAS